MNRAKLLAFIALGVCVTAQAQSPAPAPPPPGISPIKIGTVPDGPVFLVDGQSYTKAQTFAWPTGSKHVVQFLFSVDASGSQLGYQSTADDAQRYTFSGWADSGGLLGPGSSPIQVVTASSAITSLLATVTVVDRVHFQFDTYEINGCGPTPGSAPASTQGPGVVYFDNQCINNTTDLWVPSGQHILNAFPYPGWVFVDWFISGGSPKSNLLAITINSAININPAFTPAKHVHFATNPLGLSVQVDGATIATPTSGPSSTLPGGNYNPNCAPDFVRLPLNAPPGFIPLCVGDFDFVPNSKHIIGAQTVQRDQYGALWVFTGFDDGLKQNGVYTADTLTNQADTVTANFVPGVQVSVLTNPNVLKLQIDGKTVSSPASFNWGQGDTHHIVAPATTTDASGRTWSFVSWSNKGPATQDYTVPADVSATLTATYSGLSRLQITSQPGGLTFAVGSTTCVTPCTIDKPSGTQLTVAAPASTPLPFSRYTFVSWADGTGSASRTITFAGDTQTIQANFGASYQLLTDSNPSGGATFIFSPTSPDGYYASGTPVTVTAVPKDGFKFRRWSSALTGAIPTGTVTMDAPHSVIAILDAIPFLPPGSIQTAAGPTPDGSIAPGSLIAIYGVNIAPEVQIGHTNPLDQAIGNVTVTVGQEFLPLLFVSPSQINAQLSSDIAPGTTSLTVHSVGQPDVSGNITVARDAPALLQRGNDQKIALVLATHQDGSAITVGSPARRGETVTLYGTGFGPYDHNLPDGFAAAARDTYRVADAVILNFGDLQKKPDFAGAMTGVTGIVVLQFNITSDIPSGLLNLTVSEGGKSSSQVVFPVQ